MEGEQGNEIMKYSWNKLSWCQFGRKLVYPIHFYGESDYDTPGAHFQEKKNQNLANAFSSEKKCKNKKRKKKDDNEKWNNRSCLSENVK